MRACGRRESGIGNRERNEEEKAVFATRQCSFVRPSGGPAVRRSGRPAVRRCGESGTGRSTLHDRRPTDGALYVAIGEPRRRPEFRRRSTFCSSILLVSQSSQVGASPFIHQVAQHDAQSIPRAG